MLIYTTTNHKYMGLWEKIIDENEKLIENYSEFLDNYRENEDCLFPAMILLHGDCNLYAYDLFCLIPQLNFHYLLNCNNQLIHAYCTFTTPIGEIWYIDIRGATTNRELFFEEFEYTSKTNNEYKHFIITEGKDMVDYFDKNIKLSYDSVFDKPFVKNSLAYAKSFQTIWNFWRDSLYF